MRASKIRDWHAADWKDRVWSTYTLIRVHTGDLTKRKLLGWDKELPFAESPKVQEVFECIGGIHNVKLRLLTGHIKPKDTTPLDTAMHSLVGASGVKLPPETFRKLFVKTLPIKPEGELHEVYLVANISEAVWKILQQHRNADIRQLDVVSREDLRKSFRGEKDPKFAPDQAIVLQEYNVIVFPEDDALATPPAQEHVGAAP